MNKSAKRNIIISSVLAIIMCASFVAGATYAIFTSDSDVNIAVSSGKVSVVATIPDEYIKLSSVQTAGSETSEVSSVDRTSEGSFLEGGTAVFDDRTLTLSGLAPGDKVSFFIRIHNDSNISVKYRALVEVEDDNGLFESLDFNICGSDNAMASEWQKMDVGAEDVINNCYIELPSTAENIYGDKSCKFIFAVEAVQGNKETKDDVDTSSEDSTDSVTDSEESGSTDTSSEDSANSATDSEESSSDNSSDV